MNEALVSLYAERLKFYNGIQNNKQHIKERDALAKALCSSSILEGTRKWCVIDSDWVDLIEQGLDFIKKAIDEDRQFISQEGNVVPVERARRASKESAEHLARHSELMPEEQRDGNIIPEKIFVKENLINYAVYENRFLYMALCYLRDFVDIRYSAISAVNNTYYASFECDSSVTLKNKKLTYKLTFNEQRSADDFGENGSLRTLERIVQIRYALSSFLNTELMRELSKAPMLHPPVTRTNILKMDKNFSRVYALYTEIAAYSKKGYEVFESKVTRKPLLEKMSKDVAELVLLHSLAAYVDVSDLDSTLTAQSEILEAQRQSEFVNALKDRLSQSLGDGYISALEGYVTALEGERKIYLSFKQECERLAQRNLMLEKENSECDAKLSVAEERYKSLEDECERKLEVQRAELEARVHESVLEITAQRQDNERAMSLEIQELRQKVSELEKTLSEQNLSCKKLEEHLTLTQAQLHSAQERLGVADKSAYTAEQAFTELEKEKKAYDSFFNTAWNEAKRQIRKDVLWKLKVKKDSEEQE